MRTREDAMKEAGNGRYERLSDILGRMERDLSRTVCLLQIAEVLHVLGAAHYTAALYEAMASHYEPLQALGPLGIFGAALIGAGIATGLIRMRAITSMGR